MENAVKEVSRLAMLASKFNLVKNKVLQKKTMQGEQGWDDPKKYADLKKTLIEKAKEGKWVDVSNIAMFLWYHEQTELLKRDFLIDGHDPEHLIQ